MPYSTLKANFCIMQNAIAFLISKYFGKNSWANKWSMFFEVCRDELLHNLTENVNSFHFSRCSGHKYRNC